MDPAKADIDQVSRLLALKLQERGLRVIDMTEAFRLAQASGAKELFGRIDIHYGSKGYRLVADILYPVIEEALKKKTEDAVK
ncbi:MAG: hypothetical protein NC930_05475 [Candidatus Omnitrophica bacterium]|nr:hypothetical protein [Candidatus Omnitrophota bacterium]